MVSAGAARIRIDASPATTRRTITAIPAQTPATPTFANTCSHSPRARDLSE